MKLFAILLCLFPSFIFSQDLILDTIQHDGLDRDFLLSIPTYYDGSESMPVIFNFHGFGSNSTQQMFYGEFRPIAESEGIILVHPGGTLLGAQAHWNVGGFTTGSTVDDVGFTEAMIAYLIENYNIDETRIYATGMSNGGYMSYLLACQLGDRIAAIASVTGSMTPEIEEDCNPLHPTPVMQIHGTVDDVVPYDGADFSLAIEDVIDYWINYNNCSPPPQVIEIADSDTMDGSTATHIIYEFCDANITTELITIDGGGHTWPGSFFNAPGTNQDFNASQTIWDFFSKYDIDGLLPSSVDEASLTSVNVYPNPTSGILNIESFSNQDFKVFNILGTEVLSSKLQIGIQYIDLSNLDEGLYFIKTKDQSFKVQLSKN